MQNFNVPSKIVIDDLVYRKVMHWVAKAPGEVSGLGCVQMREGVPVVTEVFLLDQENTGASTDLDANSVAKLMNEHRDKDFRWWWHSHASMGVFWSGTDNATIKEVGGNGWLTATVFNKRRETKSAIFTKAKVWNQMTNETKEIDIFLEDVALEVLRFESEEVVASWDAEYSAKCKNKVFTYQGGYHGNHGNSVWERKKQHPLYDEWWREPKSGGWDEWLIKEALAAKDKNPERYLLCTLYHEFMEQKKDWKDFFEEKKNPKLPAVVPNDINKTIESKTDDYVNECQREIKELMAGGRTYNDICDYIEEQWGVNWVPLVDTEFDLDDIAGAYGIN